MGRVENKVAALTGGASGIGEATVRLLAEEGARVAFCDRDVERGEVLARGLDREGYQVVFVEAHVQHEDQAARFIAEAQSRLGELDILVNNAGIRSYQTVTEASAESWDEMIGINLKGYIFCAKAAIPLMADSGGGSIVNIASTRSLMAGSRTVQYDTTKAAILGLTRSMARDHAEEGVRVTAVGPGPTFTPFHQARAATLGQTEDQYRTRFGNDTLLKRPGTPREIAQAVVFLASDDASFITGTCLYVDGGLTAYGDRVGP
ncbi:MAG: SDR family NAD(P)-dependent oxidoreductase [Gammaproteobacteria bacterium]|nr:SDR family NAD(P)-dependent oxidoreductase [Gammaproteobacteria bacterium]